MHKTMVTREPIGSSASFALNSQVIGNLAVRALLYEVSATPKPGLVDRANNGAHKDMCFETFLDSAAALRSTFEQCAALAKGAKPSADALRAIGIEGEKAMFAATGGVNTHKGLIFSLGVICAACGQLTGEEITAEKLQKLCKEISAELLRDTGEVQTHGQQVLKNTGIRGIRGEALSGFATAFDIGLFALQSARQEGRTMNEAMVYTLICLMAKTEDSNVVYRGGLEGLDFVQTEAGRILAEGFRGNAEGFDLVRELDAKCIDRNLSPGGCADLLAISVMLYFILEEKR